MATVTDSGLVTPVANGVANIYVVMGGAQGTANIRVFPSYQGQWRGSYIVRSCTQTGSFITQNQCNATFRVGNVLPTSMTITQTGASVAGTFFTGSVAFGSFNGPIAGDGSTTFSASGVDTSFVIETVTWRINSPQPGRITGQLSQLYRGNGFSGEMRVDADIVDWLNKIAKVSLQVSPILDSSNFFRGLTGE